MEVKNITCNVCKFRTKFEDKLYLYQNIIYLCMAEPYENDPENDGLLTWLDVTDANYDLCIHFKRK